jgi:hypothetical protein
MPLHNARFRWGAFLLAMASVPATASQFLWLSDVHFDPLAEPGLVDQLAAAEPAQWAAILAGGSAKFSSYGQDTSWPLFSATLEASVKVDAKPAFIIVTGDLLAHHFRERFNAEATVHDDAAFRSFVRKSAEFTMIEIKRSAAGAPVIAALGNNDSDCGDYALAPSGPFLSDSASFVSDADSYRRLGSYRATVPALRGVRVIVLNTVFFSSRFRDACGGGTGDPGADELEWLASELREAEARHEKVWLVYHIPPGVDAYATTHAKQAGTVVMLWKEAYQSKFLSLLAQYFKVVGPNFAGHLHVDDFRLLGGVAPSSPFVAMAPAVSPITGQNPTFRWVRFDAHGRLGDQTTYYLKNLTEVGGGATPDWEVEYDFKKKWKLSGLTAESYAKVFEEAGHSTQAADLWWRFYSTSRQPGSTAKPSNYRWFYCAAGNLTASAYETCVGAK